MWILRETKKQELKRQLLSLKNQVLILRGARQVGKTSFILKLLSELKDHPQCLINFLYPSNLIIHDQHYLGRDFFGKSPTGDELIKNLNNRFPKALENPVIVFIDEVDHYPLAMEAIQTLASYTKQFKFIFTGSNLENLKPKNAATGRKSYFDLYPINFYEFLNAQKDNSLAQYYLAADQESQTDYYNEQLYQQFEIYLRLGGLPRILSSYLDQEKQEIPQMMRDLVHSIEENVKSILGEKAQVYEYEDVLRKLAMLSLNTLKFSRLQVQHAGQKEAKRLIGKTLGARVIHKLRLYEDERDLSKYILFDPGVTNYLLNGSNLLQQKIPEKNRAILCETFVGNELIRQLNAREDLLYWKSGNKAELEFVLRSPALIGIDVKTNQGNLRSLNSFALSEEEPDFIVKIARTPIHYRSKHIAKLPNVKAEKQISLLQIPHYFAGRLPDLIQKYL